MIRKTRHASLLREEFDEIRTDAESERQEPAARSPAEEEKAVVDAEKTASKALQDNIPPVSKPQPQIKRKPVARIGRPTLLDVAVAGLCALVLSFLVMFLILSPERRHDMLNEGSPKRVVPEKPAL